MKLLFSGSPHSYNVHPASINYSSMQTVFLISSYGAPLALGASYLALHSSLWASGTVN